MGTYKCQFPKCDMSFTIFDHLSKHTKKAHPEFYKKSRDTAKLFKCQTCNQFFMNEPHLNLHKVQHKDMQTRDNPGTQKPATQTLIKCSQCEAKFINLDNFNKHVSHCQKPTTYKL